MKFRSNRIARYSRIRESEVALTETGTSSIQVQTGYDPSDERRKISGVSYDHH